MARERSRDTEGPNRRENHANDDTRNNITNDSKNIAVNKGKGTSKGITHTSKGTTNKADVTTRGRDGNAISANMDDDTATVGEDDRRASPGNN